MFCTKEMKGWIELADRCIEKGLWIHAYKCCKYTIWEYNSAEWIVEAVEKFDALVEIARKKQHWIWWQMPKEEQAVANGPVFNRSFDELSPGMGAVLDYVIQNKWESPQ